MNDLEKKFAEIEKRVRKLVMENHDLKGRVHDLEQELKQVRLVAQESGQFHSRQSTIRERIEKVLRDLETVDIKKS